MKFKDLKPKEQYYKLSLKVSYNNEEWQQYSYFNNLKEAKENYNFYKEDTSNNIVEVDLCKIRIDEHKRIYSWQPVSHTRKELI